MNYSVIIIVGILFVGLLVFIIVRNQKDKKDFEKIMNNDFPKIKDQRGEIDEDDL